jgi:hypothetical protein
MNYKKLALTPASLLMLVLTSAYGLEVKTGNPRNIEIDLFAFIQTDDALKSRIDKIIGSKNGVTKRSVVLIVISKDNQLDAIEIENSDTHAKAYVSILKKEIYIIKNGELVKDG